MEQKETFFVTAKGDIQPLPTDDHVHYFEIQATYDEKQQIDHLFTQIHANNKQEGLDIFSPKRHFSESHAEYHRGKDSKLVYELFRYIYLLGTEKTKREIEEMNVLPELFESSHTTIEKVK
ncbi:hypothetical protein [Fictibacillus barbaricus]|uniref:Hydrolase n=1 Tax=Fictibacillus barbaricus TaxID=182136 RepID=A0ABS2ZCW0_9BACL|nr:hypothetical protein [Fictibacillus barbaricus]MBN3545271.1 hypothetical protein [Fictibacillus barbaricus]GGB60340.1 hypothetical protein GCM10007199_27740 [Fictibacillus barbaricus]